VSDLLIVEIMSVRDWSDVDTRRRIGAVFDRHPTIRPNLVGFTDPVTTPLTTTMAEKLAGLNPESLFDDELNLDRQAGADGPEVFGSIAVAPAWCGVDLPPEVKGVYPNLMDVNVDANALDADSLLLNEIEEAFEEWCIAADAFYGRAFLSESRFQYHELLDRGIASGDLPVIMPDPKARHGVDARFIQDVYWLNCFGPAYIERWGREQVEKAGVRRRELANGSFLVWATSHPFVFQPEVTRIDQYEWKQSFYTHLGTNVFRHEGFALGDPGEHVPTLDEHFRAARKHST